MATPVWQRPSVTTSLGDHERRLRKIERRPPGTWVYAGVYPGDPDTTPDSLPFENGVSNAGGGLQRLRYRRTNENQLEIQGELNLPDSPSFPLVVITFTDPIYIPSEAGYTVQALGEDKAAIWKLDTNGELSILAVITGEPSDGLHWGSNDDTNSDGLELLAHGAVSIDTDGSTFKVLGNGNAEFDVNSFTVVGLDNVEIHLSAGKRFQVRDSTGFRFFNVYDANRFEFSLGTTETFVVRDFGGNVVFRIIETGDFEVTVQTSQRFLVQDQSNNPRLEVYENGDIVLTAHDLVAALAAGRTFTLFDSGGNPMLQMTEGSPDLHIQAGGSVIADL